MSEYQYYEFQAIDRPLTAKEMSVRHGFSSRARTSPTRFVNEYPWGLVGDAVQRSRGLEADVFARPR